MKHKLLTILIIFLLGWFSHSAYTINSIEIPASFLGLNASEIASLSNHIEESQIHVYKDRVVIELNKPYWSTFANTNSMDPVIDENSNGIEIKPYSEAQLTVGDVVSYKYNDKLIIHRIVEIDNDPNGWYAITKGDNNTFTDPEKVRFNQIEGILVGILY